MKEYFFLYNLAPNERVTFLSYGFEKAKVPILIQCKSYDNNNIKLTHSRLSGQHTGIQKSC